MKQWFAKTNLRTMKQMHVWSMKKKKDDNLFVATCTSSKISSNFWSIDSSCSKYTTYDKSVFKKLKPTEISKVRIGNSDQIFVEGKGMVVIKTSSGNKAISDVLM